MTYAHLITRLEELIVLAKNEDSPIPEASLRQCLLMFGACQGLLALDPLLTLSPEGETIRLHWYDDGVCGMDITGGGDQELVDVRISVPRFVAGLMEPAA